MTPPVNSFLGARVRLFVDSYGADRQIRTTFTSVPMEIEEVSRQFLTSQATAR